jgi:hypothetical protein
VIRFLRVTAVVLGVAAAAPARADLTAAKSEPNLERRAEKALDNAAQAFQSAQKTYLVKGDVKETDSLLEEVRISIDLAYESLRQTGKNPSRSPKHFKKAEIRTRVLLRRMRDFRDQMSALDRDELDRVRAGVQKIHDDLLSEIMGQKKP